MSAPIILETALRLARVDLNHLNLKQTTRKAHTSSGLLIQKPTACYMSKK